MVVALFGSWLLLTILCQVPGRASSYLRTWDFLGLIPEWNFFAPHPNTGDYHLLYRDRLLDGSFTEWTELRQSESYRWWHAVWNPARRRKKALFDLTAALAREIREAPDTLQVSMAYLSLLQHVSSLGRPEAVVGTQFMIMRSHGMISTQEPDVMMVSEVHGL